MSSDSENEFVFKWKLENISFCNKDKGECLRSPPFKVEFLSNSEWRFQLFPRGTVGMREEFLSCSLLCPFLSSNSPNCQFEVRIEVTKTNGMIIKTVKESHDVATNKECLIGFDEFFETKQIKLNKANEGIDIEDIMIVRCYFYGKFSRFKPFSEYKVKTKIGVESQILELKGSRRPLSSRSKFKSLQFPKTCFQCHIDGTVEKDLKIFIQRKESEQNVCHFVECKFTVLDSDNCEVYSERATHFFKCPEVWIFQSDVFSSELYEFCKKMNFPSIVIINLELTCSSGYVTHVLNYKNEDKSYFITAACSGMNPTFQYHMLSMLQNKVFSDIKLRVNNQIMKAHRSILSARSPVFSAMFHQNMIESNTGIVDIADIDLNSLKSFLEFLYTDCVNDIDYDLAINLLMVAEKYQVASLKEKCAVFLQSEVSLENVYEILKLADVVNHENMKSTAIGIIVANSEKIVSSPKWKQWMKSNMELANEVLTKLVLNLSTAHQTEADDTTGDYGVKKSRSSFLQAQLPIFLNFPAKCPVCGAAVRDRDYEMHIVNCLRS